MLHFRVIVFHTTPSQRALRKAHQGCCHLEQNGLLEGKSGACNRATAAITESWRLIFHELTASSKTSVHRLVRDGFWT